EHHHAHDAPLERPDDLPEAHALGIDAPAAGRLVAREQVLAQPESAHGQVDVSEPPRVHAQPAEVFERIPAVGDLPVEHAAHAVGADHEIPVAEITVHERLARAL